MKVLIAVHGYPPELRGGTELATRTLARASAAQGVEVLVVAGSLDHGEAFRISEAVDRDPASGAGVRVRRLHRSDLYFDHWQKLHSPAVGAAFTSLLEQWRPDVVHVMHWLRLSDDLVLRAARAGVPALVTLSDHLTSCLLALRVHPERERACTQVQSAGPCLACAGLVPPRTPWVPSDQQRMTFEERRARLGRELSLARHCLVPSAAHGEALTRASGRPLNLLVVPPARALRLSPRPPIPPPGPGHPLKLGTWSGGGGVKGAALILRALGRLPASLREGDRGVELHLAGVEPLEQSARSLPPGVRLVEHGPFDPEDLDGHPVTGVHAMVSGSLAPESYGLVVDEAMDLSLPMLLPDTPAFRERLDGEPGVLFYEQGDEASLAAALSGWLESPDLPGRSTSPPATPTLAEIVTTHMDLWERARAQGAPDQVGVEDWFAQRIRTQAMESWDRQCAQTHAAGLGLEPA